MSIEEIEETYGRLPREAIGELKLAAARRRGC
jgi:hypothetical protein